MNMRKFFTKAKIIWTIIILTIGGFVAWRIAAPKSADEGILTDTVKRQDLTRTVLATGQVTSETDLDLSFKISGVVTRVNVKVGSKTASGQILATLNQSDASASLTSARGALAQAQANYQKVLNGASNEEIQVAQTALDNAVKNLSDVKIQQQILVDNAHRTLLNSGFTAVPSPGNINTSNPTISGSYTGNVEGTYTIRTNGSTFNLTGIEDAANTFIQPGIPQRLGGNGLYITFPSGYLAFSDSWTITIPNTQASGYVTNYNAYQAALETQRVTVSTAESTVSAKQADLNLKKAAARPAELAAAQAAVLSAQGQVETAQAAYENTILRSPSSGTITSVGIKAGELATALTPVMILQDVDNLHLEANISEANIATIVAGQDVEITFDAFGPDKDYRGVVTQIDPASTVVSGVVNYQITASVDRDPEIRPGLTANMRIMTGQRENVLAVPQRALLTHDGKQFVRVVTDSASKKYEEHEVSVGMYADGGLVEILSGLSDGQEVVTFIRS